MRRSKKRIIRRVPNRSAFTLVEMLVSVALVLMLMTMFASIFQIATNSMGKQRGISELDQKARALSTVVRKDLQHRTFRYPLAFYPGENSATSSTSFSNRGGYIYISTNGADSGLDDIIQFTVNANIITEDTDATPYVGRATELVDRRIPGAVASGLAISPNQPEADDGSLSPNSVASSPAAEVCYFIRRGNLYRRVLLIREPLSVAGQNLSPQPTARSSYNYFSGQPDPTAVGTYDGLFKVSPASGTFQTDPAGGPPDGTLTNDFYLLFDHSAFATSGNLSASFHGIASLSNETGGGAARLLANPKRRFGFNPVTGRSREHTVDPATGLPSIFLGRFTQAETSTLNFNWPQGLSTEEPADPLDYTVPDLATLSGTNGNPLDVAGSPLSLNPGNGVVSSFDGTTLPGVEGRGGERRVEDLLLSNVHEMKVELWDQRLQRFVAAGHSSVNFANGEVGDYHFSRCNNPVNGPFPATPTATVFDTWHPTEATVGNGLAPYVAYRFYPPRSSDTPPGPTPSGTTTGPFASYWQPNTTYPLPVSPALGSPPPGYLEDVVFTTWTELDAPPDGFQYDEMGEPKFQLGYRLLTPGLSGGSQPLWPTAPGRRVTDGTAVWESFDNRRPLESIRLQFRFQDKTSDNMRQLSLVIPMTETTK